MLGGIPNAFMPAMSTVQFPNFLREALAASNGLPRPLHPQQALALQEAHRQGILFSGLPPAAFFPMRHFAGVPLGVERPMNLSVAGHRTGSPLDDRSDADRESPESGPFFTDNSIIDIKPGKIYR